MTRYMNHFLKLTLKVGTCLTNSSPTDISRVKSMKFFNSSPDTSSVNTSMNFLCNKCFFYYFLLSRSKTRPLYIGPPPAILSVLMLTLYFYCIKFIRSAIVATLRSRSSTDHLYHMFVVNYE